ncbi:MAG: FAD-dependent oxidoreductase [Proteobacteria bacterium]|nr:FAD-dependent oxidoreductase [Pseudomonadota bacterium]MBU4470012.1 FAD-dependent oxidoreductase [Pseudomonadota bacterium]MCG2753793.1 FAD-dependent oxidoreductase [Desulfobacteraceae bacterium]
MKTITDPQKEIPVIYEADVVVVGGGPAGIGAALAAARNGAKTILIEKFNCLGGYQTLTFNSTFSLVDPEVQNGIIQEIIAELKKYPGAVNRDLSKDTRIRKGMGAVFFDAEYYKRLLDMMMEDAGVKVLFHAFGVGGIKEGNRIKGIFIESIEGKRAVLGKVIIDVTGSADISWKSGAEVFSDGFPQGPKKGRHAGYGYTFFFGNVDIPRLKQLRKEQPEEWGTLRVGMNLIQKAKAEGKLYGSRVHFLISEVYGHNRIWILGPQYPIYHGHHPWVLEDLSEGEKDLRKQAWSMYDLFRENVPGFENSYIEKTPTMLLLRDSHRIVGEYTLREEDMRQGRSFEDSIAISNMPPDVFGPDDEHDMVNNLMPYDIPYRSLLSRDTEGLLAAGSTMSVDFMVWCATRYCAPSICTGQAAGTAAALSVKNNVNPRNLNIQELQKTLQDQGARTSVKHMPKEVLAEYEESRKKKLKG